MAAMRAWRLQLDRRRLAKAAEAHWAGNRTRHAFCAWRARVLRRQEKAALAAQVCAREAWTSMPCPTYESTQKPSNALSQPKRTISFYGMLQALRWWAASTKAAAFAHWGAYAALRCQLRQRVGSVILRHVWRGLQGVFRAWHGISAAKAAKRAQLQRARSWLAGRKLCLSFDAWCVGRHQTLACCLSYIAALPL